MMNSNADDFVGSILVFFFFLSAAFDTIDAILAECLRQHLGIHGTALNWFVSLKSSQKKKKKFF